MRWQLDKYEFNSRGHRLIASPKLETPLREALQVLEHAELVYITVRSEQSDIWTATRLGLQALAGGKDVVRQRILERSGAAPAPTAAEASTPPRQPVAQRLQELETLRSAGAISEAEYTAKREQIINEI